MKTFLKIFNWLSLSSSDAVKNGIESCQTRQRHGNDTATTRQRVLTAGLSYRKIAILTLLLTLGVGQMWAGQGYNGESHVYLNVDGTTKYYKVSTESWSTGSSLPGTWGGVLKSQTFNKVLNIQIKGGAVGGWTENGGNISGNLYYKVTNNTTTPSSGWTTVGGINANYTTKSGNNCFRYKNDYSVNVTPTTPGTYYLHIKITDGDSNNRTSYVKIVVPSFTVAGSSAVLGSDWSATDTGNDMTFSSGTSYTLTKSNVELSTGTTYECKVVLNHDWDAGSYPGSNKTFTVDANGHYNVTFTFNASTKAVDVSTTRLYAVIYNDNGKTSGSVPATSYHANGATVTVASNSGSLAKTGYSFGGWNTNSSGTGTNYTAGSGTFTMGSSDKNLYAKWTENMSTVSFVADPSGKGTFQVGGATVTSTTAGVTTTRSVTAVAADGYHWTGWSITGGASISSTSTNPTTVTGGGAGTAATLTATFAADATNTLTVTATTGGSITTPAAGYYSDITTTGYSIAASRSEGYKFTGWTKTAGDGAVSFANASSLSTTATITTLGDVTVTAGFAAMSNSLSVSSSTLYAGDNITLSATRTNHTLDLTYQYKIGDGAWTDIATQSGTSKTWQIPYANTYQTYKFRVKSTDGSTSFYSSEQTVNVKGRITIHVKNTNSWASMYLYSWYSSTNTNGDWPGKTGTGLNGQSCSIHATGSQWWDVTITQETATAQKFILNCNTSGDKNQTGDLNLSDFTHDAYYAMSTNGSANQTLSTTTTPAAPTLSTSAAGTIRETSAVLGGNVTNLGNDIISERGYYWSTNSALSSSNLGVGTKVTVSGTQSSTGTFSSTKSSLTAGTKYYFIAYAKNGYGTSYGAVNNFTTLSTYTVTVTAGDGGTASPSSVTAGQYQLSGTITASASTGYTFYNWTKTSGSGTVTFTNANANSTTVKSTSTATVRANFVDQWNLKGDQWSSFGEYKPMTATANANEYNLSLSLTKGTKYQFKVVKRAYNGSAEGTTDTWYGTTDGAGNKVFERGGSSFTTKAGGMNNNLEVTADVTGTYTFTINTSGSTPVITVTYPTAYTITYGVGAHNGSSTAVSVSPSFTSGDYVLPETDVTFSKGTTKTGYTWKGWYSKDDGTGTLHSSTDANLSWTATRTGNISVYACYNVVNYTITYNLNGGSNPGGAPTGFTIESSAITLPTPNKTGYTFNGWYENADLSTGGVKTTIPAGSTGNKVYYAKWTPITYTIHFNGNGNTSGSMSNQTGVTYDAATTITANAFVKTGYNFAGWATTQERANAGTVDRTDGAAHGNLASTQGATAQLWAVWTPKQSALTLDKQTSATGYGSAGTVSTSPGSATYGSAMPALSGTMPSGANGYAFMGFYDATGGGGTKYYNADGSSAHNWDKDTESGTTLYAYYKKAEIAAITFDNAVVESKGTVSFAVTVSPTPVGDTKLCFTVLHSNDNPLAEQPTVTYSAGKYSFMAPEASGTYKVQAVLRTGSTCDGGTELDTEEASFQVAGLHTVTIRYKCGDDVIKAATTVTGRPLDWSDAITAPEIFGYTFSSWEAGDGVTLSTNGTSALGSNTTTTPTIYIQAIYDGYLTANYTQNSYIYFKNTLGWSDVYVNFHTGNAWNNTDNGSGSPKGVGNSGLTNRNKHMIQIGESDIYYYDYGAESISPSLYISFTDKSRDGVAEFWAENPGINVSYPANYPDAISTDKSSENGFKAATPMFVPLESQEAKPINVGGGGKANYYNAGYWTKYLPGTGYTLEVYNSAGDVLLKSVEFTSEDELMPMKAVVDLEAGQTYKYQLRRGGTEDAGIYYGNTGEMTYSNHGAGTAWIMENTMAGGFKMARITTNAAGDYTFNLSYSANASNEYRLRMAVDYPVALGDYRLLYKDNVHTAWHPSAVIPKANAKDTVSFFVRKGQSAQLKLQKCNGLTGEASWTDTISNWWSSLPSAITQDSVYNICLKHNASTGKLEIENVEPYTGNYYIRVDAANSKWDNYRSDPDHLMTYSEYSITHGGYSHYYCHWVEAGTSRKNVKFCIANDYSPCISDTLTRETASGDWTNITYYIESNGDLKRDANVRFMWNQHDNTIGRAYVDGAQEDGSRFLVISSTDGKIKQADGSALENNEVTFSDNENWIYEANVKAQPRSQFKLISTWGDGGAGGSDPVITQYFKGGVSSTETLIDGSGEAWYDIRLLYDFKTNRLVAAWVPSDANITSDNAINADVMFIREHQGDIAQVTFSEGGKISKIETAYGVIRFNKWTLANKSKTYPHSPLGSPASIYERSLFWISFPFKVKLSEVFGFGTYGEHWAIQRYDGAARAQKGHFQENGSFWRWMNRNTEYLEPNQGYLLAIDLDLLGESSDVWGPFSHAEQIELYFPSYGKMPDITNASVSQTIPSHECTINWYESGKVPGPDTYNAQTSYNRTIFDSHWNVLSVPTYVNTTSVSFANTTWTAAEKRGPKFLYTWNADDNTITATSASGYTYHAMHSYMAQYAGGITWTASSGSPASIVARKTYEEQPKEVEFRLELQQNEKEIDRTFVVLSNDEEVSAGFQFGEDMTKEFNASKASIYTFIPNVATVAGNTLPMTNQTTTVPVGVDIKANGDYTFAMPDGTSGIGVTLIDNETGVRTNLGLMDYTVTLTAGTYDQRFVLEIPAISSTPTGVEEVTGDGLPVTGARKVLIDNKLYIIKGDKVYDARGAKVQ